MVGAEAGVEESQKVVGGLPIFGSALLVPWFISVATQRP